MSTYSYELQSNLFKEFIFLFSKTSNLNTFFPLSPEGLLMTSFVSELKVNYRLTLQLASYKLYRQIS